MTSKETPAMKELRLKARRFKSAQAARDQALRDLQQAIRDADDEGASSRNAIVAAAREAGGVARQTVFDAFTKPATGRPARPD